MLDCIFQGLESHGTKTVFSDILDKREHFKKNILGFLNAKDKHLEYAYTNIRLQNRVFNVYVSYWRMV